MEAAGNVDGRNVAPTVATGLTHRPDTASAAVSWRCAAALLVAVGVVALVTAATFAPAPREALPFSSSLGPDASLRDAIGSQHRRWDDVIAAHPFVRAAGNVTTMPVYARGDHGTVVDASGATVLTRTAFFHHHVATSTPALVRNAWSDAAAVGRWSDADTLVGAIGRMPVPVQLVERGAFDLHSTWREETMP